MNITCRKTGCKYNDGFVCLAKGIEITSEAGCSTFCKAKTPPDTSKKLLKKTPKYRNFRAHQSLNICCSANCQFNQNSKCLANGITINDLENCPYCISYFQKLEK